MCALIATDVDVDDTGNTPIGAVADTVRKWVAFEDGARQCWVWPLGTGAVQWPKDMKVRAEVAPAVVDITTIRATIWRRLAGEDTWIRYRNDPAECLKHIKIDQDEVRMYGWRPWRIEAEGEYLSGF